MMYSDIFAKVPHYVFDELITYCEDKALALFLLLRFRAGTDLTLYTNGAMLCQLLNISNRPENKIGIDNVLSFMERAGWISITQEDKSFFCISLNYETFFPNEQYFIIYQSEFDVLSIDSSRDKLLAVLCCIKKYQHQQTKVSFVSMETIINSSHVSKPTVCKCLKKLEQVLDTHRIQVTFMDNTFKNINYYRSKCDGYISDSDIRKIIDTYYSNIKSIILKTQQND